MADKTYLASNYLVIIAILVMSSTSLSRAQYKPQVTIPQASYIAALSDTLTIWCDVDANPDIDTITWTQMSGEVSTTVPIPSTGKYSGGIPSIPSLTINNFETSDTGQYQCTVANTIGTGESPIINVIMSYKPKVTIPKASYIAALSDILTIRCDADANPDIDTIRWTQMSGGLSTTVPIPSSGKYSGGIPSTPSLTINNFETSDAGQYQCTAVNNIGTGESPFINVTMSYAPRNIQIIPTFVLVNETHSATVMCRADGVPDPIYTWFFASSQVGTGSTFSIASTKREDDGPYTCKAINTDGEASIVVDIDVQYKPNVTIPNASYIAAHSDTLKIRCDVDANPEIHTVTWTKMSGGVSTNVPIPSSGKYSGGIPPTPSLTINNFQTSDAGQYQCTAVNDIGIGQSPIIDVTMSSI